MTIITKLFGEVEVDENKIILFSQGIIGFPELKRFMLIHDSESNGNIRWLQSIEEPAFAMPVIDPLHIMPEYNPNIEDELLKPLGTLDENNMLVLVTITVPKDIEKMSVNLRAPIIICGDNYKACQVITDDEQYVVKYPIYTLLKELKEKAGE